MLLKTNNRYNKHNLNERERESERKQGVIYTSISIEHIIEKKKNQLYMQIKHTKIEDEHQYIKR